MDSPPTSDAAKPVPKDDLTVTKHISDLLIVVFVHGFKGTDETFGGFPERLQHILSETISEVAVECLVFPAYEVRQAAWEAYDVRSDSGMVDSRRRAI